jgi:hypothetical protein
MSAATPSAEDRQRASFAALILMLRELAHGLFQDGHMLEGRALVDGIEALRAKAAGNLTDEEARFLKDVLFDLHVAAVKAPPSAPPAAPGGDTDPAGGAA